MLRGVKREKREEAGNRASILYENYKKWLLEHKRNNNASNKLRYIFETMEKEA